MKRAFSIPRHGFIVALTALCTLGAMGGACGGEAPDGRSGHPNLLLVVVDGLHADEVGRRDSLVPRIDRLAREGARFESATLPSMDATSNLVTLHTSLPPERHRVRGENGRLDEAVLTLAEVFRAGGFATAAVGEAGAMNSVEGLDQGFGHFEAVAAERVPKRLAAWLEAWAVADTKRPFFAMAQLSVEPNRSEPSERQAALSNADARVADIIATVEGLGHENPTLVVLTATHNSRIDPRRIPTERDLGVPLIFHHPARLAAGVVHDDVARTMDLGPTVMMLAKLRRPAAFGFNHDAYSFAMRDLVEVLVGIPRGIPMTVTGEGTVEGDEVHWLAVSGYRIIRRSNENGTVRHHFFHTAEDPEQRDDLIEREAQRARMSIRKLDAWLAICAEPTGMGAGTDTGMNSGR